MTARRRYFSTSPLALRFGRQGPWVRLIMGLACVVVCTGAAIGLALWWEDRPLRVIEQSLVRKDFDLALDQINAYLKEFPSHSLALDQKARALAGLERWADAGLLFERIGAESLASQRAWSRALFHEQRWTEAQPLLSRLSEQFPDDGDLLHDLSECEYQLGYFDESIQAAERLVQLKGQERRGRLQLGMLHYKRFNNRWAIQAWRPLIDQDSDLSDLETPPAVLLLGYGRALLDDGRPAEALGQLERAVRLDSTDDARNALAEACNSLGDCPRAVALWKQVVERNSANRPAREGLAQAALEERAPVEARRWLEPLLSQNDLHSSTAFLAQRAARMAGDKEAAALWTARANVLREREIRIRNLEQSLRDSPRSFSSRCVHAHRFASEGNLSQALVLAEDLLTERPDDPFVSQLTDAIHNHGPLPPLESIPFEQF